MCGIFGAVNFDMDEEKAIKCLETMAHRGPDGGGIYRREGIILGHRRLSILDLSEAGKQPMEYQDGRYVITYNGEIYNFLELKRELRKYGYTFKSDSDTEVILAAYQKWGKDCLTHFNGMWAFAIWDSVERTLFMSRDRFGIKPLYYAFLDGKREMMGFASEMKGLIPILPTVNINYGLLEKKGIFGYEATEECIISEIKRFPAGSYGYFKDGQLKICRWWNTLDHLPQIPDRYEEQAELFRELFADACKIRMRSDVTIGTALSGGIDSSATICTMAHTANVDNRSDRINADWQHAFVATFPGTTLDESAYAKIVTDYLNINHTFVDINSDNFVRDFEKYLYLFEEIYITTPIPMMKLYGEVKKSGVTVTIDGHGADELFCGYPSDFYSGFIDAGLKKQRIDEILQIYSGTFPHDGSNLSVKNRNKNYKVYLQYILNYCIKNPLHRLDIYKAIDRYHPDWKKMEYMNKVLYMRTHQDILPTLLRNYDHYSMASGVEIRMPFMDYRVVTLAFALSGNAKLRNGYSKAIVRDGLACYMPDEIVRRKTKIGFHTPLVEWMQGALKEFFGDLVTSADFINSNMIDGRQVRSKILKVLYGEKVSFLQAEDAYRAVCPFLWERYFYKKVCNMLR